MNKMAEAVSRLFDPKKWHVSIALLITILWATASSVRAFARVYDRLEDLEQIPHISNEEIISIMEKVLVEKLDANNDKLILRLDERYEKKK